MHPYCSVMQQTWQQTFMHKQYNISMPGEKKNSGAQPHRVNGSETLHILKDILKIAPCVWLTSAAGTQGSNPSARRFAAAVITWGFLLGVMQALLVDRPLGQGPSFCSVRGYLEWRSGFPSCRTVCKEKQINSLSSRATLELCFTTTCKRKQITQIVKVGVQTFSKLEAWCNL